MANFESRNDVAADGSAAAARNPLGNEALSLMMNTERNLWKAAANQKDGIIVIPAEMTTESGKKVYSSWASEIVFGGQYTARPGDDLHTVAKRSLGVTGHPRATESEIRREMARIVDLNKDDLPHGLRSHDKLPAGLCLKLKADDTAQASEKIRPNVQAGVTEVRAAEPAAVEVIRPAAPENRASAPAALPKIVELQTPANDGSRIEQVKPLVMPSGSQLLRASREPQWGDPIKDK